MIMEFTWPYCEKCGHGVERVQREIDFFTGDVIYTVTCHGARMIQRVIGLDVHDINLLVTTACWDEKPTDAYPSVTYKRDG